MTVDTQSVESYYERTHRWMGMSWPVADLHHGMHANHGPARQSLPEMTKNTNRVIAQLLHPKEDTLILDAGCGLGGSALFIAREMRARVHGITNSPAQIAIAQRNAEKMGLRDRVQFSYGDMTETPFASESFDGAYALESMCHLTDRSKFTKEMARVLRPDGMLVIADTLWYGNPSLISQKNMDLYEELRTGWVIPPLPTPAELATELQEAGFHKLLFIDEEEAVRPFRERVARLARIIMPCTKLLSLLHLIPAQFHATTKACSIQKTLADRGLIRYGIFTTKKL